MLLVDRWWIGRLDRWISSPDPEFRCSTELAEIAANETDFRSWLGSEKLIRSEAVESLWSEMDGEPSASENIRSAEENPIKKFWVRILPVSKVS